jgi:hypothetical protein
VLVPVNVSVPVPTLSNAVVLTPSWIDPPKVLSVLSPPAVSRLCDAVFGCGSDLARAGRGHFYNHVNGIFSQ